MTSRTIALSDGRTLLIRDAVPDDAPALLAYLEAISGESDFLTFGPGEFELTEAQEAEHLRGVNAASDQLYVIGTIDREIVASLTFSPGRRQRTRHVGEFALAVRAACWNLGIGALMLDVLLDWTRASETVGKVALRVRTDNARGIALYQRLGFVTEGTLRREICVRGEYHDLFYMGLQL
jgi:RimJ/RimL family protein N-acetyltransferase